MELQFSPRPLDHLCVSYHECKKQEETLETIVPDSYPDVQRILCAGGTAVVRSRESHNGSAAVSGGVRARVLYMAEGETVPRCLENYLPFHIKAESAELTDNSQIMFRVHVLNVDVRMLNSRKIILRANLCWELTAYDACSQTLYELEQPPAALQTKTAEYELLLPAETSECAFSMTEELRLPSARPMTGELMQFMPRPEITEKRIAGDKAVFKGIVHLRLLYATEDGLAAHETELPFSQFCRLQNVYEEDDLELWPVLTECETERSLQGDGFALQVTLGMQVQCLVKNKRRVQLVEDAYCPGAEFIPQWAQCSFPGCLDKFSDVATVRESREGDVSDVLLVWVTSDLPEVQRQTDDLTVTYPMLVSAIYLNSDSVPHFMCFRTRLQKELKLSESGTCIPGFALPGQPAAVPTGSGMELRFPVSISAECRADGEYRALCGGEIRAEEGKRPQRPAVIVRRTRSGELLWDIAKRNGTTIEKIRRANGMTSDTTEAGVLLIPT